MMRAREAYLMLPETCFIFDKRCDSIGHEADPPNHHLLATSIAPAQRPGCSGPSPAPILGRQHGVRTGWPRPDRPETGRRRRWPGIPRPRSAPRRLVVHMFLGRALAG